MTAVKISSSIAGADSHEIIAVHSQQVDDPSGLLITAHTDQAKSIINNSIVYIPSNNALKKTASDIQTKIQPTQNIQKSISAPLPKKSLFKDTTKSTIAPLVKDKPIAVIYSAVKEAPIVRAPIIKPVKVLSPETIKQHEELNGMFDDDDEAQAVQTVQEEVVDPINTKPEIRRIKKRERL